MAQPDLIIRGRRVVLPDGITAGAIHVIAGRVAKVTHYDDVQAGCELFEASEDHLVMPGLVDTHVHVNEPGRTDWEGFATATQAAAAGGVTTIVDMPLNSIPPTTTAAGLAEKTAAAKGQCYVDVGFWGGVVPDNTSDLGPLQEAGVLGFKCFLIHSGVEEFPNVSEQDLRRAMPELKRLGALLIVHAEVPGPIERLNALRNEVDERGNETEYVTFLRSRPRAAENEAVELIIGLAREFGTHVHIVHHSSADALPILLEAKKSGVAITVETCPHYLVFAAEEIDDGATEFKCCPPIREKENREKLWQALMQGVIDMVVSDHSPCPPELKLQRQGDFLAAWGGISSLQLRLPVMWTEARRRGRSIEELARWLCSAPAELVELQNRKGSIAAGCDADIVIWNPDQEFRVQPEMIHHRHKITPYAGRKLFGTVEKTFLRGRKIYDAGEFSRLAEGEFIHRLHRLNR